MPRSTPFRSGATRHSAQSANWQPIQKVMDSFTWSCTWATSLPVPKTKIMLLDFEHCCQGWYSMDSALLLFDAIVLYGDKDADGFAHRFLAPYLRGYATERALSRSWLHVLPLFLKAAEYAVYTRVYPGYRAETADSWTSRFMPGRRQRIEAGLPYVNLDLPALERELERGSAA